jgi:hypothetical protein
MAQAVIFELQLYGEGFLVAFAAFYISIFEGDC